MQKRYFTAVYRLFFGVLILVAIVVQFMTASQKAGFDPINFLSFFTIESNILAASLLLILGCCSLAQQNKQSTVFIRGAVTLYMTVTGVVYVTLLSGHPASLGMTLPWVNLTLHYIMPIVILLDWIMQPPQKRIAFSSAVWWLAFPLLYLVYSLFRGSFVGWYPYPFLNVTLHGYPQVLLTSIGIALVVLVVARLLLLSYVRPLPKKKKR